MQTNAPNAADIAYGFSATMLSSALAAWWKSNFNPVSFQYPVVNTSGGIQLAGFAPIIQAPQGMVQLSPESQSATINFLISNAVVTDTTGETPLYFVFNGGQLPNPPPPLGQVVQIEAELVISVTGVLAMVPLQQPLPPSTPSSVQAALAQLDPVMQPYVNALQVGLDGQPVMLPAGLPANFPAQFSTAVQSWISSQPLLASPPLAYFLMAGNNAAILLYTMTVMLPVNLDFCVLPAGEVGGVAAPPALLVAGCNVNYRSPPSPLTSWVTDAGALFTMNMPQTVSQPWSSPPPGVMVLSPAALSCAIFSIFDMSDDVHSTIYQYLTCESGSGTSWIVQVNSPQGPAFQFPTGGTIFNYQPPTFSNYQDGWWSNAKLHDTVVFQLGWSVGTINNSAPEMLLQLNFSHVIEAFTHLSDDYDSTPATFLEYNTPATAAFSATFGLSNNGAEPQVELVCLQSSESVYFDPDIGQGTPSEPVLQNLCSGIYNTFNPICAQIGGGLACAFLLSDLAVVVKTPALDENCQLNISLNISA